MTEILKQTPQLELPTPMQLRRFAATAMAAASAGNKLRKQQTSLEPAFVWVDARYNLRDNKPEQFERRSGRFARRILEITHNNAADGREMVIPDDRWSLRYNELMQDHLYGNEWIGTLKRYAFEWDNWGTIQSVCTIREASAAHKNQLFPELTDEGTVIPDDAFSPSVRQEIVSKEHFGELIGSVRSYHASLWSEDRAA
jgi:hypothetical protein